MILPYLTNTKIEAGCDEAGRGCLAGPVFAAAVILPHYFRNDLLDDSKKLNNKNRKILRKIIENESLAWAVAQVDQNKIDMINILNATYLAMHQALDQLIIKPELILVDGNCFKPYKKIEYHCIVKGDGKIATIAAASILAKTHRDEYMHNLSLLHPEYLWNKNKGYPTKEHKAAISKYGICEYHRKSFRLNEQLKIGF